MVDPLIIVRAIHFAATIAAAGTVFFQFMVAAPAIHAAHGRWPPDLLHRLYSRLALIALTIVVLSGLLWLLLLASEIYGASIVEVCLQGGALAVLTNTRFGLVWIGRLALALLLAQSLCWPRAQPLPAASQLLLLAAAGLLVSLAWIGHAGATLGPAAPYHLASDVLHLTAAGIWLGGLLPLLMLLRHAGRARRPAGTALAAAATRRFSLLAMLSVGALLATGIVNAWTLLGGARDLLTTDYGRLILLKTGVFAAMLGIAYVNRFHLTPRLAAPWALRRLRRNTLAEIGLGLCIMLFVGALGALEPTAHAHLPAPAEAGAGFVHIHSEQAVAEVAIAREPTGAARATIRLMNEDFTPRAATQVTLSLMNPGAGLAAIRRPAVKNPDETWIVDDLLLPQPGRWELQLDVRIGDREPITLVAPILLEP